MGSERTQLEAFVAGRQRHRYHLAFFAALRFLTHGAVHGGYASKSEPCRSAFHMAFIQTLMSCGFNNPEEVGAAVVIFFLYLEI